MMSVVYDDFFYVVHLVQCSEVAPHQLDYYVGCNNGYIMQSMVFDSTSVSQITQYKIYRTAFVSIQCLSSQNDPTQTCGCNLPVLMNMKTMHLNSHNAVRNGSVHGIHILFYSFNYILSVHKTKRIDHRKFTMSSDSRSFDTTLL